MSRSLKRASTGFTHSQHQTTQGTDQLSQRLLTSLPLRSIMPTRPEYRSRPHQAKVHGLDSHTFWKWHHLPQTTAEMETKMWKGWRHQISLWFCQPWFSKLLMTQLSVYPGDNDLCGHYLLSYRKPLNSQGSKIPKYWPRNCKTHSSRQNIYPSCTTLE